MKKNTKILLFKIIFIISISLASLIVLLISIWAISGARNIVGIEKFIFNKRDSFYVGNLMPIGKRIPLIPPYNLESVNNPGYWSLYLQNDHIGNKKNQLNDTLYLIPSIVAIDKFSIIDRIILIHTSWEEDKYHKIHWIVIIPDQNIEFGFISEEEFKEYLSNYGVHEIEWFFPDIEFDRFSKTGCLIWIPDCQIR